MSVDDRPAVDQGKWVGAPPGVPLETLMAASRMIDDWMDAGDENPVLVNKLAVLFLRVGG